ncbi:ABC transporter ATP-binding protein [Streptomyces sp. AK02-01A]|uniref:ABC transporter ATP-binding protein n=1 Tax=Streptomyces sp. AK02-01A TaxID=3028648 RepID=UPI0029BF795C|nr:ABC transporter ATP-binding protein [Streptomyces sp. AK02-01A]MDX3852287.1 ABC transporter ATP-binding protein [Streptomyces sp. AK02-01A]
MQQVVFTARGAASTGGSGLTGAADFSGPERPRRPRGARARLRRAAGSAADTVAGLGRVLALVWRASPVLTLALGVSTVLIGLVPAAVAMTGRLLVNTVVEGAAIHSGDRADRISLDVPLPGFTLQLPVLSTVGALVVLAAVQFAVYALSALGTAVRSIAQQLLQEKASQSVQLQVMEHAGRLPLSFFEDSRSYDLLRQAQQEASTRPVTMIGGAFNLLQMAVTFLSMVGLLFGLGPVVAVAALLAPVPAFVSDSRYSMRGFMVTLWSSPIRRRMEYLSRLLSTDAYAKEVKVYGLGPFLTERFRLLGSTAYRGLRGVVIARYLMGNAWSTLTTLVGSLTYLYVAVQAVNGRLSLGDLILYTSAATSVQASIQGIFTGVSGMYENNLYLRKLYELLAVPVHTSAGAGEAVRPAAPLPSPLLGHVVLENVTFRYPGADRPALAGVSLDIPPGTTLAVVGRNGAGKSTLIKLLCRLYEPDSGRILLDGTDIRDLDPEELRSNVAAMFQDFVSYQASFAENIGLGDTTRVEDRDRVEEAARRGGAAPLTERLPDGYDTALGKWFDTGVELSGGEWQKVALSRAFMRDAPLLVLDEPTSALDAEAEHELFARLRDLAHGRTTVYISHRFSTVRHADLILLIEDGRPAEQGTHEELMRLGGSYARLFALQASAYTEGPLGGGPVNGAGPGAGPGIDKAAAIEAALAAKGKGNGRRAAGQGP